MTTERIKSVGVLIATLIVGILLGVLLPALFHKVGDHRGGYGRGERGGPEGRWHEGEHKGEWLAMKLHHILEPDSVQEKKIEPIANWAIARLDSIEHDANSEAGAVLDSLKQQIKPLVTEEQWSRLEEFDQRVDKRWHHRGRHRH